MLYREDIRLKTALKLLTLRANNTLEAKAFNWFTMAFSFGRSNLQEKRYFKGNFQNVLYNLTNELAYFPQQQLHIHGFIKLSSILGLGTETSLQSIKNYE